MKKAQSVGLIGTGNLTDSPVTRFWFLPERLGPVKSASYRVASRIANMLQAGHPVKDYAEFQDCDLVLICVPEETIAQVVSEMSRSGTVWRNKAVVLCSTWLDSGALQDLAAQGAFIGSISPIPGFDDERYLAEGDPPAIRRCKSLVEHRERRVVAVERSLKPFYLAALTCTGTLLFALLYAAGESLHRARIPPALSAAILERQLTRTLRSFLKSGLRAAPELREVPRQIDALSSAHPQLAQFLEQTSAITSRLMAKP